MDTETFLLQIKEFSGTVVFDNSNTSIVEHRYKTESTL